MLDNYISLVEWAKMNGITPEGARVNAKRGKYKTAKKIGGVWIIDREEKGARREKGFLRHKNLYNFLKSHLEDGGVDVSVEELRSIIGLEPNEIKRIENFRVYVLQRYKDFINNTDIKYEFEKIVDDNGIKIVGFRFFIFPNDGEEMK